MTFTTCVVNRAAVKSFSLPGGHLEHAVLIALDDLGGRASARAVHERVGEPRGLVYTTTAKVLDRLWVKGLVSRERIGKAFAYRPKVRRETLEQARAKQVLGRLLGPEPRPAIATLVDAVEAIDPALLDELARTVAERRKVRRGS